MTKFYELSFEERVRLTEDAIQTKKTITSRWAALADNEANPWDARSEKASTYLAELPSITDYGCGTMILKKYLQSAQTYVGVDVVARDIDTIVCDLNVDDVPQTGTAATVMLGVIEYLHDPLNVLKQMAKQYDCLVATYCVIDAPDRYQSRREHGWVNDYTRAEVETLLSQAGWTVVTSEMVDGVQRIWRAFPSRKTVPVWRRALIRIKRLLWPMRSR